jgi:hypothetical protein
MTRNRKRKPSVIRRAQKRAAERRQEHLRKQGVKTKRQPSRKAGNQ